MKLFFGFYYEVDKIILFPFSFFILTFSCCNFRKKKNRHLVYMPVLEYIMNGKLFIYWTWPVMTKLIKQTEKYSSK